MLWTCFTASFSHLHDERSEACGTWKVQVRPICFSKAIDRHAHNSTS